MITGYHRPRKRCSGLVSLAHTLRSLYALHYLSLHSLSTPLSPPPSHSLHLLSDYPPSPPASLSPTTPRRATPCSPPLARPLLQVFLESVFSRFGDPYTGNSWFVLGMIAMGFFIIPYVFRLVSFFRLPSVCFRLPSSIFSSQNPLSLLLRYQLKLSVYFPGLHTCVLLVFY